MDKLKETVNKCSERYTHFAEDYEEIFGNYKGSYYHDLEAEFSRLRVFGDERDLNLVKEHNHEPKEAKCVIHKKDAFLYPEVALADSNLIAMCELCVIDYLEAFKEYRKTHRRIIKDRRVAIREKKT